MKITNRSIEVAALALANNIGDEDGPFADLTEVLESWGAESLTQLASNVQCVILASLPHLESDAHAAYEAETASTAELMRKNMELEGLLRTEAMRIENLKTDRDNATAMLATVREQLRFQEAYTRDLHDWVHGRNDYPRLAGLHVEIRNRLEPLDTDKRRLIAAGEKLIRWVESARHSHEEVRDHNGRLKDTGIWASFYVEVRGIQRRDTPKPIAVTEEENVQVEARRDES